MSATADPTMDLFHALNRADPSEWSRISYGMPIFVEHEGWEIPGEEGKKRLVVVPKGEKPPEGGKKVYEVDKNRLAEIAREINRQYEETGTPVKLFIGHSDPKKPQSEQPPLVGFGRGAYLGRFGPKQRLAIKTDAFYKPGYEQAEAEYPERSPEFLPRTNGITGVALLKTDPRLKMGIMAYEDEGREVILYGCGFMDEVDGASQDDDEVIDMAEDKVGKVMGEFKRGELHSGSKSGPTVKSRKQAIAIGLSEARKAGEKVPTKKYEDDESERSPAMPATVNTDPEDDDDEDEDEDESAKKPMETGAAATQETKGKKPKPFEPHEAKFAERLMKHLESTHPAIKYLCGQHTKYMSTQSAMAQPVASMPGAASATSGYLPKSGGSEKSKKKPESKSHQKHVSIHMSTDNDADQERIDYAEMKAKLAELESAQARIAKLEEENAILYATEAIETLEKQGKVIKDKSKEIAKLVKMTTMEERQEYLKDIRVNYADAERSPARGRSWLPIDDGNHVEGAIHDEPIRMPDAQEMLEYAEENNIDMSTEEGTRKVVLALTKKKSA